MLGVVRACRFAQLVERMNATLHAVGVEHESELPYKVGATKVRGKGEKQLDAAERAVYDQWKGSYVKEWAAIEEASKMCQVFRIQIR
jgi:hypothetical protein